MIREIEGLKFIGHDKDGIPMYEHTIPYITGLSGCNCHPFLNWADCDAAHTQTFDIGQKVKLRCHGRKGEIYKDFGQHYWLVKFGPNESDKILYHSANLVKI